VNVVQVLHCLKFEKKDAFYQKISRIFAYGYSIVIHCDPVLLLNFQTRIMKLKSGPESST
jgi:hypothetical protein